MGLLDLAFASLILFTVMQRLAELVIAKRNTARLLENGGVEFGASHYPVIVALHIGFFLSMILEFVLMRPETLNLIFLPIFFFAQLFRAWIIATMRTRWTTRVIVMPGEELVRSGPFKFLKHPNYLVVAIELLAMPMIFDLTITAILFSILNAMLLMLIRIPVENAALAWSQQPEEADTLNED